MSSQLQATVDICFKIKSFRNLTESYLRSMYFKLSVNAGTNLAVPYQIISEKQNLSSITLLQYISPLVSFGPLGQTELNQLVIFRLNIPFQQIEEDNLTYKFSLVESSNGPNQRIVGELDIQHKSLLWVNCYSPVYFPNNGCGIDITVKTQLLKFRTNQLKSLPKKIMTTAMELLLVSFNRIKNRLSEKIKNLFLQKIESNSIGQFQKSSKQPTHSIFQTFQKKQQAKQKLIDLAYRLIPELGICIQQGWSQYLRKQLLVTSIEKELDSYLNASFQKVKQTGNKQEELNPQGNCSQVIIESIIKTQSFPTIQLLSRNQKLQTLRINTAHHFVILVHGYGATSSVMIDYQLLLRYLYPHLTVINSRVNQNQTEDQIINMGKRLASQVEIAITSKNCGEDYSISFITHSLGGLITRSALTLMQQQRYHMKCFISLGTPHLGHLYHNSAINKFGIWALAAFNQSKVMSALLLQNQQADYRKSYIYELSMISGLSWFEEVIFYASKGDKFVSIQSSLCLSNEESSSQRNIEGSKGAVWEQMKRNMQASLQEISYSKYLVDFSECNKNLKSSNFTDDWMGRRDHMNLCMYKHFVSSVLAIHKNIFK